MSRINPLLQKLLAAHGPGSVIDLDAFAEETATLALSHEEIGELIDALSAAGRTVGSDAPVDLRAELRVVLDAARKFTAEKGRKPTLSDLVEATGLSVVAVRRALQFGRIAGR
ncbi:MAG: hypothetical protein HOW73_10360 [Polyangiaceae bacterium]|nr:hypothetical protein [Polyangiaceae bacterium]